MDPKSAKPSEWEARSENELLNALDVCYEMAVGYVLGEMREKAPEKYEQMGYQPRKRVQLVNTVRFNVDAMLNEIIEELVGDRPETEEDD